MSNPSPQTAYSTIPMEKPREGRLAWNGSGIHIGLGVRGRDGGRGKGKAECV